LFYLELIFPFCTDKIRETKPDYLLIFGTSRGNYGADVVYFRLGGKFVVPIPEVQVNGEFDLTISKV